MNEIFNAYCLKHPELTLDEAYGIFRRMYKGLGKKEVDRLFMRHLRAQALV